MPTRGSAKMLASKRWRNVTNNNNNNNNNRRHKSRKNARNHSKLLNDVRQIVVSLFPEIDSSRIEISYGEYSNYSEILIEIRGCKEESAHKYKWYPEVFIQLEQKEMHIEILTSCDKVTGTMMLDRFIEIARRLNLSYITLDDLSNVYYPKSAYSNEKCGVSLSMIEILQSGQSWYQRKGFNTNFNRAYLEHNLGIALMPFHEFIDLLINKQVEYAKEIIDKKCEEALRRKTRAIQEINQTKKRLHAAVRRDESLFNLVMTHFPAIDMEDHVSEGIYHMIDVLQKMKEAACETPQLEVLQHIVRMCGVTSNPVIKYDSRNLMLTVPSKPLVTDPPAPSSIANTHISV